MAKSLTQGLGHAMAALNGWQRLWLFVSVLWLVLLAVFYYPVISHIEPTNDEIVEQMPPGQQSLLIGDNIKCFEPVTDPRIIAELERRLKEEQRDAPEQIQSEVHSEFRPQDSEVEQSSVIKCTRREVKLPISHYSLKIRYGIGEEEINRVIATFSKAASDVSRAKLRRSVFEFFLYGTVPMISLYVFGWGIGWVCRGFKKNSP